MKKQLLTYSRQDCFKHCRRRHWFAYELGIRKEVDAKALRMGTAYAAGQEQLALGKTLDEAVTEALNPYYDSRPDTIEEHDWLIEAETVARFVCAYQWRWEQAGLETIVAEQPFFLPLLNPQTGQSTPLFALAGKFDGIVRLEDGRMAVKENKWLSESLDSESDLWRRLRVDHQISLYMIAARRLEYNVETVLYDVTRKPTIRPEAVPLLDKDGLKIVLDANDERVLTKQGKPRQTGDKEKGYVLQTRPMTPDEWGEKLTNDITERPEYYFTRVEIPRLDTDLSEYKYELWDIQKTLREAQRLNRWYRTVGRDTCPFCPYFEPCTNGWQPGTDPLPEGFITVENLHPELGEYDGNNSVEDSSTATSKEGSAAQEGAAGKD